MILNNRKTDLKCMLITSGITQKDLATILGVTSGTISAAICKTDNTHIPKSHVTICEALGYDIELKYVPRKKGDNNGKE